MPTPSPGMKVEEISPAVEGQLASGNGHTIMGSMRS